MINLVSSLLLSHSTIDSQRFHNGLVYLDNGNSIIVPLCFDSGTIDELEKQTIQSVKDCFTHFRKEMKETLG